MPAPAAAPTPQPTAAATPTVTPSPSPAPVATATPAPIETVVLPPQGRSAAPPWPWLAGAGLLGILLIAWAIRRHRHEARDAETWAEPMPEPAPEPGPPAEAAASEPVPAKPRPAMFQRGASIAPSRLALAVRPTRAGLNLISATVDCEVTIANEGPRPAEDIRAELRLMSAHAGQDSDLASFYAEPTIRPATPPFALAPGEERRVRIVAALPHDVIRPLQAGGRPMFVPLLALAVRWRDGDAPRRAGQAYAVGIERVDSTKLAPFWLDTPPRQYDGVVARPHGAPVEG